MFPSPPSSPNLPPNLSSPRSLTYVMLNLENGIEGREKTERGLNGLGGGRGRVMGMEELLEALEQPRGELGRKEDSLEEVPRFTNWAPFNTL